MARLFGRALVALVVLLAGCRRITEPCPRYVGVAKPVGAQHGWHGDSLSLECRR